MLVEFSVKNFMSFKDKVTFSMEAATGAENEENIINIQNIKLSIFNKKCRFREKMSLLSDIFYDLKLK